MPHTAGLFLNSKQPLENMQGRIVDDSTVLIEIIVAFTKKSGRVILPDPIWGVWRVTNDLADQMVSMGVAKKLNLPGKCVHAERHRRRMQMRKEGICA